MLTFGYVKGYKYANDGTLLIQVRIPSIHGAYNISEYGGKTVRNYTKDEDLPWVPSILLPHLPGEGEVVVVASMNYGKSNFVILGMTGGSYNSGATNPDLQ